MSFTSPVVIYRSPIGMNQFFIGSALSPATDDPRQRPQELAELAVMAERLIRQSNGAPLTIRQVREVLCPNCRELNASQSKCYGESLERCLLLSGAYRRRMLGLNQNT